MSKLEQIARENVSWAEIDLDAYGNNIREYVKMVPKTCSVMAVLKANGYGHGDVQKGPVEMGKVALREGAKWIALAHLEEALQFRKEGIECPLLVMGYIRPAMLQEAIRFDIDFAIWSKEQGEAASEAASVIGQPVRVHVKMDSGMGRLGVMPQGVLSLFQALSALEHVNIVGFFTHFAKADEEDLTSVHEQLHVFRDAVGLLEKYQMRPSLVHCCNSAATLRLQEAHMDAVRVGIATYGLHPSSSSCPCPPSFRPVMTLKSILSQVKWLSKGHGISYGHEYYVQEEKEQIGIIPCGYADGYRRWKNHRVLIRGISCPIVGRVCMDRIMCHLPSDREFAAGDEVVLVGKQGKEFISAEEVASLQGTINYEVTCNVSLRVPRVNV